MVWWIPIAMAAAQLAGKYGSKSAAKKRRTREYRQIEGEGGLANHDPTYGAARDSLGEQDEGPGGLLSNLLGNFQGRPQDMEIALQRARPFIAGSLGNTKGFKDIQNYQQQVDELPQQAEMMQAFGTQAGQQAQAAGRAGARSRGMLANSGLGNSSAMAALAGQQAQGLAGNQSDLFTKMYQASLAQRMQNAQLQQNWAGRAYDTQRDIANMAMGAFPNERTPAEKTNLWGPIAQTAGQAIGSYLAGGYGGGTGAGADASGGSYGGGMGGWWNAK